MQKAVKNWITIVEERDILRFERPDKILYLLIEKSRP